MTARNTHDTFWAHVDELLDARRDPFDDPTVAHALLDDPVLLDQLEQLLGRLQLATTPTATEAGTAPDTLQRTGAGMRRWAAAALLLLGLGLAAWFAQPPRDVVTPLPIPTPRARIHSFHSTVHHERRDAPLAPTPDRPVLVSWRQTWITH